MHILHFPIMLARACTRGNSIFKAPFHTRYNCSSKNNASSLWSHYMSFLGDPDVQVIADMLVMNDFLSETEEKSLFDEVEPYMKRLRYEFDHWDDAIHGFRETERRKWNVENSLILQRVKDVAFPVGTPPLSLVHVLDLAEKGVIKPHIDSERFCGNTIAGLSLLSNSVMRLIHHKEPAKSIDVLLRRRSLYIMKGVARYKYTHQILPKDLSSFNCQLVPKGRRLSIICRNEPNTR